MAFIKIEPDIENVKITPLFVDAIQCKVEYSNVKCEYDSSEDTIKDDVDNLFETEMHDVKDVLQANTIGVNVSSHQIYVTKKSERKKSNNFQRGKAKDTKKSRLMQTHSDVRDFECEKSRFIMIFTRALNIATLFSGHTQQLVAFGPNFVMNCQFDAVTMAFIKTEPDIDNVKETLPFVDAIQCKVEFPNVKREYDSSEDTIIDDVDDLFEMEMHDVKDILKVNDSSHQIYNITKESEREKINNLPCEKTINTKKSRLMQTHSDVRVFECEICEKVFKLKQYLSQHMITHSDVRHFECDKCGKTCKTKRCLSEHMLSHSDVRDFKCNKCKKVFKRKQNLSHHMLTHNDDRDFECEICRKSFKFKQYIVKHMKTHSDVRNVECDKCGKSLKNKYYLSEHMLTHSNVFGFKCEKCEKVLKNKRYLLDHMQSHNDVCDFKCEKCGKACKTKRYLSKHMLTHSDNRNFECERCGKAFKIKQYLSQHIKIHSNVCDFECEICGKAFKFKPYLLQHMKTHSDIRNFE